MNECNVLREQYREACRQRIALEARQRLGSFQIADTIEEYKRGDIPRTEARTRLETLERDHETSLPHHHSQPR